MSRLIELIDGVRKVTSLGIQYRVLVEEEEHTVSITSGNLPLDLPFNAVGGGEVTLSTGEQVVVWWQTGVAQMPEMTEATMLT